MQKAGLQVKALDERVSVKPEFLWLYDAYRLLSRSRQLGAMGEFYIPMTEYVAYCDLSYLDEPSQRMMLVETLSQVDAILLHERFDATSK